MKNIYFNSKSNNLITGYFLLVFLLLGIALTTNAQIRVPFTQRTSQYTPTKKIYNVKGDFTIMGNTNMTLQNYGDQTQNGNNTMIYVDVDGNSSNGVDGKPTFNSSRSTLTFSTENGANPSCSNIIYAGLYWSGRASDSNPSNNSFSVTKTINGNSVIKNFDKRNISLKGPNAATYTQFTASTSDIYYPTTSDGFMYSAYKEVTDYVRANGIGEYTAADLAVNEGNGGGTGFYGGWSLIVVYENSKMKYRDVTIFDGHAYVTSGTASFEIPVSGFNTVQSGPVGVKLGLMAGEGDNGISGDYFEIKKQSDNTFTRLSHPGNSTGNFFTSSIQTGGNARTPNLVNNTGLDISMFNIPNANNSVLTNNQTSTTFRYGSTQDTYVIFAIAMAVDAYIPEVENILTATSIDNVPVTTEPYISLPGQDVGFNIDIKNLGTEAINNYKVVVPIPYNASYVPGSAVGTILFTPLPTPNTVSFDSTAGATGSIVWNMGTLPLGATPDQLLAKLSFKLKTTTDCSILLNATCGSPIFVTASSNGTGAITGIQFAGTRAIKGYTDNGVCTGQPILETLSIKINGTDYVAANCQNTPLIRNFGFCNSGTTIGTSAIAANFPPGSTFYNEFPVTINSIQYSDANPFPLVAGSTVTYYSLPPNTVGCSFPFTISKCKLIDAVNDSLGPINGTTGSTNAGNIFSNNGSGIDTLGGNQVLITQVNLTVLTPATPINGGFVPSIDLATGNVVIPSGTPAGSYSIVYQICEKITPSNCDSATVTICVGNAPISGGDQVACQTIPTQTLTATATAPGQTIVWYNALTNGSIVASPTLNTVGTVTYYAQANVGTCSFPTRTPVTLTIKATPSTPLTSSVTQPTCAVATGSFTISNFNVNNTYTITPSTGVTVSNTGLVTAPAGNYTITASANGCTSAASASITVNPQPQTPTVPLTSSVTQPTCVVATGSFTISNFNVNNTYTITPSTGVTVSNTGLVTAPAGTYTITASANGCTSVASASITVNPQPETPVVPVILGQVTQPTCTVATGSFTISNFNVNNNYTITPSTGVTVSNTGLVTAPAGTYSITASANGCTSAASASITVNPQPQTPTVPITSSVTQPTCVVATGSFTISNFNVNNTYTITPSTGVTVSNTGLVTAPAGTYTITASANGCTSVASASITVNPQPETPVVPVILGEVTQPTCTIATGSFTISNFNINNTYTITPSTGVTASNAGIVTAPAGTYTITASANGCTSAASASITVNPQPETPIVPAVLGDVTQPTCAVPTGSFTISNFNVNNTYTFFPSLGVSVTSTGIVTAPAGTYTITASANGCTSAASASVTVNPQPETPVVPVVLGDVTQPTCAVATGSFTISNFDVNNTYTFFPSLGVSVTSTGIVTAPAGTYTITASANGCTSAASASITVNPQPETPVVPVVLGEVTQPTCAVATGSFTISNFDVNNTYTFFPSLGVSVTSTGIVTAPAGTYTITASANGCTSAASASITVNPQPETPEVPVVLGEVTQPTCAVATGTFTISNFNVNNTYTFFPSLGVSVTSTGIVTAPAGTYTITASANGCTSAASASITVNPQPETPIVPVVLGEVTQPTCTVATGSFTISNFDLNNTYTFFPSLGVSVTSTGIVTAPAGTYTITASANGCTSAASASITVNPQPETPVVPVVLGQVTQPTCTVATGSFTISNFNVNNTYTFFPSLGVSVTSTGIVTAPAGTYTITASANGCTSAASASITVNPQPETPVVPVVLGEVTQPTCTVATGSFAISNFDLNATYTFFPSLGVSVTSAGIVTAPAGTYTITASANGCTSAASASITVNPQPETPVVPVVLGEVTQPTCTVATGTFTISNFNVNNTYTFFPSLGVSVTSTGIVTAPAGTYTITASANGCTSAASASITVNPQPETPVVPVVLGDVTQPTCAVATGSFTISNFDINNTYTFFPSLGVSVTSTGIVTAPAGTYTITASANGCTSAASASITVNPQPETPVVPVVLGEVTQPTCAVATGSFTISNFDINNTYTFFPSLGVSVTSTGIVTAPAGTYTITASANGCTSAASASITVNPQPETPVVPVVLGEVTQPTCAVATGTFTISNFNVNNTYTFFPSLGVSVTSTGIVTAPAGTYTITASANGCTSAASASITVNPQPQTPVVPVVLGQVTQPTCTVATGSFTISNFNVNNTYTFFPSLGVSVTSTGIVTAPAGTYTITASANGCTSAASASITVNPQPETPVVPVVLGDVTQPTCAVATGTFTISNFNVNNTYTFFPSLGVSVTSTGIVTAPAGTYTITASANGCTSAASASVTINASPLTPTTPIVGNVTQPTCALATGSVVISGLPTGSWTLNQAGTVVNIYTGNTASTTVSGLIPGMYNFTVTNSDGCTSSASTDVVINASPVTPAAPIVGNVTQPTCALATGSVVLSGLPTGTWTINPGNITGNTTSTTISGLTAGTYNYTVTNSDGCTSSASTDVVINASPVTPAAPIVGNVTQPTCALATGSVVLSGLPTGTWTINPGNITGNTTSTTISGLTAGTYNYTVTNSDGCTSNASTDVTINVAPVTPTAPIVGNVTQPTCAIATGSVVLSGLPTGTWNINPGNISGNTASTIISGLSAGTYNITVTNSDGCTSAPASNFSINTAPVTPTAPIIGNVTQPTCTIATGSIELIGLPNGTWNINPGNITGATNTTILTGLSTGSYSYTVTNSDGCTSVVSAIAVINIQPLIPNAPTTGGDQSKCEATPLQTLTATATVNAGETITWYDATGNVVTSPTLNSVGTVSYYAESSNGSCSSLTRTEVILTINAINLVQVAQPILAPCNNDNSPIREIDLDTLLPAGTTPGGSWSTEDTEADQGLIGNIFSPYLIPITTDDNIPYTFKYMVNCEVVEVKVNVDDDCSVLDDCDVIKIDVRNAFSPNGDEINKVFIIRNINQFDCFPTNTVEIYNRWGVLVYETKQYDNETRVFKGISEGRVTVDKGAQLPTGTYFYVLNYTTKTGVNKSVEGYLFLTQ